MSQELLYTYTHREFYETIHRYEADPQLRVQLEHLLPADWKIERSSVWLHARNPAQTVPTQGFKLHVSSTPHCAAEVLDIVGRECVRRGLSFKCTADVALLQLLISKPYERGGSGKFMTIYPGGREEFEAAAQALHDLTKDKVLVGPYILTDRRYTDSKIVYYRYGGMMPLRQLTIDGAHTDFLVAPTGDLVRDERLPFFKLPEWVDDPFGGTREIQEDANLRLGGRFSVASMLSVTNRGGVYAGRDEHTGAEVVIKEARPHVHATSIDGNVIDSGLLLEREFRTLEKLRASGYTAQPIALLTEWEHTYLAQERLPGISLREFLSKEENFILPYILRPGVLTQFVPRVKSVGLLLLDVVERIHAAGFLVGDLSPSNILVNDDGTRLWLIDLESAVAVDDHPQFARFSVAWNTPGFRRFHNRSSNALDAGDDLHACGVVLLSMFVTGISFLRLDPSALERLLRGLVELGVPHQVRTAVMALSTGDMETARNALTTL